VNSSITFLLLFFLLWKLWLYAWVDFSLLFLLLPELPAWSGQSLACLKETEQVSEGSFFVELKGRWVYGGERHKGYLVLLRRTTSFQMSAVSNRYICSTPLPLVVFVNGAGYVEKLFSSTSRFIIMWKISMVLCRSGVGDLILKVLWIRKMEVKRSLT